MADLAGKTLAGYDILSVLGQGGMGTVYRARQLALDREVAFKVLHSRDPLEVERFLREGRALSQLRSPDIVAILDAGVAADVPYLVLELIEGRTLDVVIAGSRPSLENALDWVAGIASALAFAHERGILHRDVKPSNVFLCAEGHVK